MTVQRVIDLNRVRSLAEDLRGEGKVEEASDLTTLLELVTASEGYYTAEEVARKFRVSPRVIMAFVRNGTFQGIVVGEDKALIPKSELREFEKIEPLARELDELVSGYTQEEIYQMVKEARREWQRSELF